METRTIYEERYITDLTPDQTNANAEKKDSNEAAKILTGASFIKSKETVQWMELTLDILDDPTWSDFMLGERLDFYVRAFGDKSVAFVFLHTDSYVYEINLIISSFKWPNETGVAGCR